jgi:hypothetical protein
VLKPVVLSVYVMACCTLALRQVRRIHTTTVKLSLALLSTISLALPPPLCAPCSPFRARCSSPGPWSQKLNSTSFAPRASQHASLSILGAFTVYSVRVDFRFASIIRRWSVVLAFFYTPPPFPQKLDGHLRVGDDGGLTPKGLEGIFHRNIAKWVQNVGGT